MAAPSRPINTRHSEIVAAIESSQRGVFDLERTARDKYKLALENKNDVDTLRRAEYELGQAVKKSRSVNQGLIDSVKGNIHLFQGVYNSWEEIVKANRRFESNMRQAGGDLRRAEQNNSQQGFRRQMMLQAGAQGVNAIAELSTVNRLPVIGGAIQSGVGTAINAGMMGAGAGTALGMGLLAGGGALIAGGVANAYNQFESEEALERQLGQRVGVGAGRRFIRDMRTQGLTRDQIGGLGGGLSQTVGSTTEAVGVYQMQTAFGVNPMGAMGAMASTGRGSQLRMVQDAISVGMAQGLARGRFGEMVDGLQHLVRQQGVGVGVGGAELGGTLGYMGVLGKGMGIQGSQFMNVMGQLDASARGKTGGLSESISFLSAYNYLQAGGRGALQGLGSSGSGGDVTPFDIQEVMERGSTGKGGMGRQQIVSMLEQYRALARTSKQDMELSARKASNPEERAEINAAKLRYQMMQSGLVTGGAAANMTVARQLTDAFLTSGDVSDKDIKAAQEAGKSQQERSFDEIHEQTGLQQRIAYGIEALGRSLPGTGGAFNRTFEGLLAGLSGSKAERYKTQLERADEFLTAGGTASTARDTFRTEQRKTFNYGHINNQSIREDDLKRSSAFDTFYGNPDAQRLQDVATAGGGESLIKIAGAINESVQSSTDASEEVRAASEGALQLLAAEINNPQKNARSPSDFVPSVDSAGDQFTEAQKLVISRMIAANVDTMSGAAWAKSPDEINSFASRLNKGEVQFPLLSRSEDVLQFYAKRLQEVQPLPGQATQ